MRGSARLRVGLARSRAAGEGDAVGKGGLRARVLMWVKARISDLLEEEVDMADFGQRVVDWQVHLHPQCPHQPRCLYLP